MSEKTHGVSQAELGETDASLFSEIMGNEPDEIENETLEAAPEPEVDEEQEPEAEEVVEPERDEQGRFAAKKQDAEPAPKGETPAERGLRGELRSERDKRQAAEAERDRITSLTNEFRAEIEALKRAQTAQPAPQPAPQPVVDTDPEPDMFTDPVAYRQWNQRQTQKAIEGYQQGQERQRVEWSLEAAHTRHGDAFTAAQKAAESLNRNDPVVVQTMRRVFGSRDPGEALVAWHRNQVAMQEIGNDPAAYRAKVLAEAKPDPATLMNDPEVRKQVLAILQAEARQGQNGSPRTVTSLPPSLNNARGGQTNRGGAQDTYDNSDRGVFEYAMRS